MSHAVCLVESIGCPSLCTERMVPFNGVVHTIACGAVHNHFAESPLGLGKFQPTQNDVASVFVLVGALVATRCGRVRLFSP